MSKWASGRCVKRKKENKKRRGEEGEKETHGTKRLVSLSVLYVSKGLFFLGLLEGCGDAKGGEYHACPGRPKTHHTNTTSYMVIFLL